jgi:hypothetical protein
MASFTARISAEPVRLLIVAVRLAPTVVSKRMARPSGLAVASIIQLLLITAPFVGPMNRTA